MDATLQLSTHSFAYCVSIFASMSIDLSLSLFLYLSCCSDSRRRVLSTTQQRTRLAHAVSIPHTTMYNGAMLDDCSMLICHVFAAANHDDNVG